MVQESSNYSDNKFATLTHKVPEGLADRRAMTAQEYINNERSKQHQQLRNWHLQASNSPRSSSAIRSNFFSTRSFESDSSQMTDTKVAAVAALLVLMGMFFCYFVVKF